MSVPAPAALPGPGQLAEGAPELGGHQEVGEEVGRGVGEDQEVHGVAQRVVALLPEGQPVDGGEHPQHTLGIGINLSLKSKL